MPLRRYVYSLARIAMAGAAVWLVTGCAKDPLRVDRNRPPRTFIVAAPEDSSVSHNVNEVSYRVHLYWRGEDPDGYVAGFLWSFDDSGIGNFRFTTRTDSIFEVTVNDSAAITQGSTLLGVSRFHTFFVRAVDNLGKADPSLAIYNRTTYRASTIPPSVRFVGGLPSGIVAVDTLSDGQPFRACWTGNDSDGVVVLYKFDAGTYTSPLRTDTCATFNDPLTPGSVALASGLYTMTVTAVDNAFAVGKTAFQFVVNHDPETWFEPKGSPIGHYIQPFLEGTETGGSVQGTFAQGDTIPYRSTIWFTWDGEDVTGGETNQLTGWSLFLRNGTRNTYEPYVIGFLDTLSEGPPPVRFKTNNPAVLGPLGFTSLILDSLDSGVNIVLLVASRDASNRADGTPASFRFNCNRKPELRGTLTVTDSFAFVDPTYGFESGKAIYWNSYDFEDGEARNAEIRLDAKNTVLLNQGEQSIFVPDRVFRSLSPTNPHQVDVRVSDRAEYPSDNTLTIQFDVSP